MRKFLREYRIEFFALLLVLLGIVVLILQSSPDSQLRQALGSFFHTVDSFLFGVSNSIRIYLWSFGTVDLLGLLLIFGASLFVLWRVQYRMMKSERWQVTECPKCGSPLRRTHRSFIDRIITKTILPNARRYSCSNRECDWRGLRIYIGGRLRTKGSETTNGQGANIP